MKVVQINAVCGVGSTGRICQSLSQLLCRAGVENYVLYAQGGSTYPLGIKYMKDWEIKAGALASRIGGNDGFNNRPSTRRLLSRNQLRLCHRGHVPHPCRHPSQPTMS